MDNKAIKYTDAITFLIHEKTSISGMNVALVAISLASTKKSLKNSSGVSVRP